MAFLKFTDALMESKRRARLQGREVSQQEAAGISEGIAASAGERALMAKQLQQQETQFGRKLEQEKYQFGKTYELQIKQLQQQYDLAKIQLEEQIRQFNESSEEQKRQFGEQMAFQIGQSDKQSKQWATEMENTKGQAAMDYIMNNQPVPAWTAPEGWDAQSYLSKNPDVAQYYTPSTALRHYWLYGKGEGREM